MNPAFIQAHRPVAVSGFSLEIACKLDAAYPGYLNRTCYASNLKRQAQFAAYAEINFAQPNLLAARFRELAPTLCSPDLDPVAQIARGLTCLRARQIVQVLFGNVPDGYLGLLARLGSDPLPNPTDYRLAFSLFADPPHKARAKLLRQIEGQIGPGKISVVARLDPVLLHKAVLDRVYDAERLNALHAALALIRALVPDATDAKLRQSLNQLSPSDHDMSKWLLGWLRQMQRLPVVPPVTPGDPELRLLQGCDMPELGRRFQNCAADRVGYVATATRLYYEWIGPGAPAVVELRCLQGGRFLIEDIKGVRNATPSASVANAIRARLSGAGVLAYAGHGGSGVGGALMMLLNAWDFDDQGAPEPFLADLIREAA